MTTLTAITIRYHQARRAWRRTRILALHADLTLAAISVTATSTAIAAAPTPWTAAAYAATVGLAALDHRRVAAQAATIPAWIRATQDWQPACAAAGLTRRSFGEDIPPRITRITRTRTSTTLTIRPHRHHTPTDYTDPQLTRALGARHATATRGPRGAILLTLHHQHPTPKPFTLTTPTTTPNLTAIPITRDTHTGRTHPLPLAGTHLLIAGNSRAGKSNAVWSLIQATHPAIQAGTVQWRVIDPKGGMELDPGRPLFHTFVHGGDPTFPKRALAMLEDTVHAMNARAAQLRGTTRALTQFTPATPLTVVLVDEVLALRASMSSAQARDFDALLKQLLAMGAAVGYTVIVATQDVRKDAGLDAVRDLIPTRVCLRVNDTEQVDMTLGRGSHKRGAHADRIDFQTERGVAYVASDEHDGFARVRFGHVTDSAIARMTRARTPEPAPSPVHLLEAAPDAEPLRPAISARRDEPAVEGVIVDVDETVMHPAADGTKRSRTEAVALLVQLHDRGEDWPAPRMLAAWGGRSIRWAQMAIRDAESHVAGDAKSDLPGGSAACGRSYLDATVCAQTPTRGVSTERDDSLRSEVESEVQQQSGPGGAGHTVTPGLTANEERL